MNISIQDSLQQLKEAVEELEALRTVIAMAEDHPVYSCDRETLIVTRTALEPILNPILVAVLYGEMLGKLSLVGAVIVLAGILYYNLRITMSPAQGD